MWNQWLEWFWIIKKNVIQMAGERGSSTSAKIKPYSHFPVSSFSLFPPSSLCVVPRRLTTTLADLCRLRPDLAPMSSPSSLCVLSAQAGLSPTRSCLAHHTDNSSSADHHIHLAVSTPARPCSMHGHHAHRRALATTTICSCVHRTENSSFLRY